MRRPGSVVERCCIVPGPVRPSGGFPRRPLRPVTRAVRSRKRRTRSGPTGAPSARLAAGAQLADGFLRSRGLARWRGRRGRGTRPSRRGGWPAGRTRSRAAGARPTPPAAAAAGGRRAGPPRSGSGGRGGSPGTGPTWASSSAGGSRPRLSLAYISRTAPACSSSARHRTRRDPPAGDRRISRAATDHPTTFKVPKPARPTPPPAGRPAPGPATAAIP